MDEWVGLVGCGWEFTFGVHPRSPKWTPQNAVACDEATDDAKKLGDGAGDGQISMQSAKNAEQQGSIPWNPSEHLSQICRISVLARTNSIQTL